MSVIKTAAGWVELGASHPLERAYEAPNGDEVDMRVTADVQQIKRMPFHIWAGLMPRRIAEVKDWSPAAIRAWNVNLAQKVGVPFAYGIFGAPDDVAVFGHYPMLVTETSNLCWNCKNGTHWMY